MVEIPVMTGTWHQTERPRADPVVSRRPRLRCSRGNAVWDVPGIGIAVGP